MQTDFEKCRKLEKNHNKTVSEGHKERHFINYVFIYSENIYIL